MSNILIKYQIFILDASNIALNNSRLENFSKYNKKRMGIFRNIKIIEERVLKTNPKAKIYIICDANLPYCLLDRCIFEKYRKLKKLYITPAKTPADFFILKFAQRNSNSVIISNDTYKEFNGSFEEVKKRRIPFMIIDGDVIFYENLEIFLTRNNEPKVTKKSFKQIKPKKKRLTYVELAIKVLEEEKGPLSMYEIWEIAKEKRYHMQGNFTGRTPWKSIASQIYIDMKNNPETTIFIKTGSRPVRFGLKSLYSINRI
ncbi:MAG: HTH domain-containing protein [Promethearchaeota archaeon]